jgi:hypothetical protein
MLAGLLKTKERRIRAQVSLQSLNGLVTAEFFVDFAEISCYAQGSAMPGMSRTCWLPLNAR